MMTEFFASPFQAVPLHFDPASDPARGCAVIGGLDFHTAVQMNRAVSVLVVAEGFDRQWPQCRFLFCEPCSETRSCQIAMALRPRLIPSSMASWKGLQALADGWRLGFSDSRPLNSTPKPVVTSMAGFAESPGTRSWFSGRGVLNSTPKSVVTPNGRF